MKAGGNNSVPVVNEVRLRVRYAETDQMGVAYHSNHFIWFEVGRVELLRQLGFSYRDMESEDRRFIAVAEAKCRYRYPVRYDEEVGETTNGGPLDTRVDQHADRGRFRLNVGFASNSVGFTHSFGRLVWR